MNRRQMLKYIAGGATLAALKPALTESYVDFDPEAYSDMLNSGKPFLLGFLSDW